MLVHVKSSEQSAKYIIQGLEDQDERVNQKHFGEQRNHFGLGEKQSRSKSVASQKTDLDHQNCEKEILHVGADDAVHLRLVQLADCEEDGRAQGVSQGHSEVVHYSIRWSNIHENPRPRKNKLVLK